MLVGLELLRSRRSVASIVVALAAALLVFVPPLPSEAAGEVLCEGLVADIVGTTGSDTIEGTPGDDVIHGLAGADFINGKGGNDVICGGTGLDELWGSGGDDVLVGGKGADYLKGGPGNDVLKAGLGHDILDGDKGDDILSGGDGIDVLRGGKGVDTLRGKLGRDSLFGDEDDDVADGGSGKDQCQAETEDRCEQDPIEFSIDRVYVNQAVPAADSDDSPASRVPSVEGRAGVLRVFVTASRQDANYVPDIKLHWRDGQNVKGSMILSGPDPIPTSVSEGTFDDTFDYFFDSSFLDEGMDIYIEIDPDGNVPEADETNNRWPASGWYDLEVTTMPSFDVTFVPMTVNGITPALNQSIAEGLLEGTLDVMPIADYTIEIHPGVSYNGSNWGEMLDVITQARIDDGSSRVYVGIVDDDSVGCCTGGIGWIGWGASVSLEYSGVVAHELGHNLNLLHAPCGNPSGPDPGYPYGGGLIGSWGYEIDQGSLIDPTIHRDLMTYCSTTWISDYNYDIAAEFRNELWGYSHLDSGGPDDVVMSFTGVIEGVDEIHVHAPGAQGPFTPVTIEQVSRIKRVAEVDAAPLPPLQGANSLVGVDATGAVVTSVSFAGFTVETANSDAAIHYAFSVPMSASDVARVVEWRVFDGAGDLTASLAAA